MSTDINEAMTGLARDILASISHEVEYCDLVDDMVDIVSSRELFGPIGLMGLETDVVAWDWIAANRHACLTAIGDSPNDPHWAVEDPIGYANEVAATMVDDMLYGALSEAADDWGPTSHVTPQLATLALPYVGDHSVGCQSPTGQHRSIVTDVAGALARAMEEGGASATKWWATDDLLDNMDTVMSSLPASTDEQAFAWFGADPESVIETASWINENVDEYDIPNPIESPKEYARVLAFAISHEALNRAFQEYGVEPNANGLPVWKGSDTAALTIPSDGIADELRRIGCPASVYDYSYMGFGRGDGYRQSLADMAQAAAAFANDTEKPPLNKSENVL